MKSDLGQVLQRDHYFAIVDEVDSILIDEARTPLIISGPSQDRSELYITIDRLIPELTKEHYELDEKQRTTTLTEEGNEFVEQRLRELGCWRRTRRSTTPRAPTSSITSTRRCAPTCSSSATRTTSSATAR